jgi:hypothetical protein
MPQAGQPKTEDQEQEPARRASLRTLTQPKRAIGVREHRMSDARSIPLLVLTPPPRTGGTSASSSAAAIARRGPTDAYSTYRPLHGLRASVGAMPIRELDSTRGVPWLSADR